MHSVRVRLVRRGGQKKLMALKKTVSLDLREGGIFIAGEKTARPRQVSHRRRLLKIYFDGCIETTVQFPTEDSLMVWVDHLHSAFPSLTIESAQAMRPSTVQTSSTFDDLAIQYLHDDNFRASVHRIHRWLDDATSTS